MAANRRRDTSPELQLRSALHRRGFRFRVDFPIPVFGRRPIRPDVVFTRGRVAVFVDGCFWHGCPDHGRMPKANAAYWEPKIAANKRRDRQADELLTDADWIVVRVWEHDSLDEAIERVAAALRAADARELPARCDQR